MPEPKMPSPEQLTKIDKSRREAAKVLIDEGADFTVGAGGEEMEKKLKKENAGEWVPDLGSWIRLQKTILCPVAEIGETLRPEFKRLVGRFLFMDKQIWFIDKEGNLAAAPIPVPSRVGAFSEHYDELYDANGTDYFEAYVSDLKKKLMDLAFVLDTSLLRDFQTVARQHRNKITMQAEKVKQDEFDF